MIGAINTLTRAADGRLLADNTDWVGIRNLLAAGLRQRHGGAAPAELCALVLGAGGTARAACHALRQLGAAQLYVFNRTREKAEALGAAFDAVPLSGDLDAAVGGLPQLHLLVSCIPGSAGVAPSDALLRRHSPVVLDAAYRPRDTPLLAAARRAGCTAFEGASQTAAPLARSLSPSAARDPPQAWRCSPSKRTRSARHGLGCRRRSVPSSRRRPRRSGAAGRSDWAAHRHCSACANRRSPRSSAATILEPSHPLTLSSARRDARDLARAPPRRWARCERDRRAKRDPEADAADTPGRQDCVARAV